MKKIIISILSLLIVIISSISVYFYNQEDNSDLTKIRVAEVTHSAFYAPLYVAIENGYFNDLGLDIELILTPGADKVSAAVISGDVEIGFCGPESTIYIYEGGEKDYLISFAGLTKRDGQFIVSREDNPDFKLEDVKDKTVLVGRLGGMPALNFINALDNEEITDVSLDYSVEFANLASAFISGTGDYVNLFEPNATLLEKQGFGHIMASVGTYSGTVPYTAFNTLLSYYNDNHDILINFSNAINKGLEYVKNNDAKNIANVIIDQFPDSSINDLERIINNYKQADSWYSNTFIPEADFQNLGDMLLKNDLIKESPNYQALIKNVE